MRHKNRAPVLRMSGNDFEFSKHGWDCLELTLETGLERLAPLRHTLEKLTVSGLDEVANGCRSSVQHIFCY
jgi:hypothetical protein